MFLVEILSGKDSFVLTRISQASFCRASENSVAANQTPHDAASDQGLHCLLTECSIKI